MPFVFLHKRLQFSYDDHVTSLKNMFSLWINPVANVLVEPQSHFFRAPECQGQPLLCDFYWESLLGSCFYWQVKIGVRKSAFLR